MTDKEIYQPSFELPTESEVKFLSLLQEYKAKYISEHWDIILTTTSPWFTVLWIHQSYIISKDFWFIQRLVENDKIDRFKINFECDIAYIDFTDKVLMLLSISDTPISDLCSYLK